MNERARMGHRERGKEKRKVMKKRGECVVTGARRVKRSHRRTGTGW